MKKLTIVGAIVAALTLSACGAVNDGYSTNGGWSPYDWDLNNPSIYNNQTYCHNGTYKPLPNNMYSCTINGTTSRPSKRPTPIIPPKSAQRAPAAPKQNSGWGSKSGSGSSNKAPSYKAPSYKAPSFKSGK